MRIGVLSFSIVTGSGESRFAINLSRGLIKEGNSVTLFAYSCNYETAEELRKNGVDMFIYKYELNKVDLYRAISDNKKVFSQLLKMIKDAEKCDYYLVLNDALVGIVDYKKNGKWIYISNGDLTFLFLNQRFIDKYSPFSHVMKRHFVSRVMKHKSNVLNYDYLFANSKFTQTIMSFFLDTNFTNYVYPPVDTEFFKRSFNSSGYEKNDYALVMLRNIAEPMVRTIQSVAKEIPVKIVGGAKINGAFTLGKISDAELVNVYSNALVTIGPSKQEFFGYATAESLSCGTPVLAFKQGGAVEMIEEDQNGWLVETQEELLDKLNEIFKQGYDKNMVEKARKSSEKFSIAESSKKLISLLK